MRAHTRGDRVIDWIEKFCLYPDGPHKGEPLRLSPAKCWQVRQIYDSPSGPNQTAPLTGPLAAYLALASVCSHEALQKEFQPQLHVDAFTIWRATSKELQAVLRREGEAVACPELGTKFPAAA
jgi:hypothetical protein